MMGRLKSDQGRGKADIGESNIAAYTRPAGALLGTPRGGLRRSLSSSRALRGPVGLTRPTAALESERKARVPWPQPLHRPAFLWSNRSEVWGRVLVDPARIRRPRLVP
jgi:hypothetical protein